MVGPFDLGHGPGMKLPLQSERHVARSTVRHRPSPHSGPPLRLRRPGTVARAGEGIAWLQTAANTTAGASTKKTDISQDMPLLSVMDALNL